MRNDTKSKIIIEMNHIDNATYLEMALKEANEKWACGGDAELNGHYIGHDVNVLSIRNEIER